MTTTDTRTSDPAEPLAPVGEHVPAAGGSGPDRTHPVAWWGMMLLVVTEAMVFVGLLSSWFYVWAITPQWPPSGIDRPELVRISLFSLLLLGSSIPMVWAEHAAREDRLRQLRAALAIAFAMAAAFLANQVHEYTDLGFAVADDAYTSLFVVITGLHGLHVLGALVMSTMVQAKAWTGRIDSRRLLTLRVFGIYWHFVDGVWVAVFASLYLALHLVGG